MTENPKPAGVSGATGGNRRRGDGAAFLSDVARDLDRIQREKQAERSAARSDRRTDGTVEGARPEGDESGGDESGGPEGPDPTRFGDWERKGRCIDF